MMKKLLALACMAAFGVGRAQIVNIPDANFKNALVNTPCVDTAVEYEVYSPTPNADADTNNDGEIDEQEALAVTNLTISGQSITSLAGIAHFTNLQILVCDNNALTSLDVSMIPGLFAVSCAHNALTTLALPYQSNPSPGYSFYLNCPYNALTSLDLGANPYDTIDCTHNLISNLDFADVPLMYETNFSYNQLTDVVVPSGIQIGYFDVSDNPLTSLLFESDTQMESFRCVNTPLTSIDLSKLHATVSLTCTGNPNLTFINLRNGTFDGTWTYPYGQWSCSIGGNPALQYVCVDDISDYDEIEPLTWTEIAEVSHGIDPAVNFTYYCSLTPTGQYNTVTGNLTWDCGGASEPIAGARINVNNWNAAFAGPDGAFLAFTPTGNQTFAPQFANPYFTVTPPSYTFSFADTGNTASADFCVSPSGLHPDLEISLVPEAVRPGFDTHWKVVCRNVGTETQSGHVTFNFDETKLDFISASDAGTPGTGSVSWDFTSLSPFQQAAFDVVLHVHAPVDAQPVQIGDNLDFTALADGSQTDETPANNTIQLTRTAVGSYDPNDKTVSRETVGVSQLGDDLYYTVRFQNTGTYQADQVVIRDIISDHLNLATLQVVAASHPMQARISTLDRKVEFIFQGISLPASQDDEPGSHGFVTYKLKPVFGLAPSDEIANNAEIFFDYNSAIVTNTVTTTVTQLGNASFIADDFSIFPNPTSQALQVKTVKPVNSCRVSNLLGQWLMEMQPAGNEFSLDVSRLPAGTYFLNLDGVTKKFIKQ